MNSCSLHSLYRASVSHYTYATPGTWREWVENCLPRNWLVSEADESCLGLRREQGERGSSSRDGVKQKILKRGCMGWCGGEVGTEQMRDSQTGRRLDLHSLKLMGQEAWAHLNLSHHIIILWVPLELALGNYLTVPAMNQCEPLDTTTNSS